MPHLFIPPKSSLYLLNVLKLEMFPIFLKIVQKLQYQISTIPTRLSTK
jgi:hypothetical protein